MPRVIQVIETDDKQKGDGKSPGNPYRVVTTYHTVDGEKLAERDDYLNFQYEALHCAIRRHHTGEPEEGLQFAIDFFEKEYQPKSE